MSVLKFTAFFVIAPLLKTWYALMRIFYTERFIPTSPETLLKYLFSNKRLEILEFLTDVYFRFGLFRYEGKIYVLDPKVCMKVINKLDKGAHDYLSNSPLHYSFLGATNRSPEARHVIAAIFRKTNMERNGAVMVEVIKKTVEKMRAMKVVNLSEITLRMALDIVGRVLLGLDLGAVEGKQDTLLEAMMTILHRSYALGVVKPGSPEFKRASDTLDKEARGILTRTLNNSEAETKSFAQLLHEEGGFEQAVGNLKLFLMAGSETTASSIPVLMSLIAHSPGLQGQLQQEADEFIAKVTKDSSCTPPKLESAIKELLRTYAIAPYISRQTHEALDVECVTLPANSDLRIFTWGIHRSPQIWDHGKDFKPFRFLQVDSQTSHRSHTWIPFGAGSRICIGQHLAWVEMRLALIYFLHHFNFQKVNQTRNLDFCVDWEHAVVHPDNDVILGITPR